MNQNKREINAIKENSSSSFQYNLPSDTQNMPIVEASKIVKKYGTISALAGLNLKLMPSEIYGLLGPNGAGKSTLIKVIAGLVEPTSGSLRVLGFENISDPVKIKSRIGYVSENSMLYESLSPRDFFEFVASIRNIDKVAVNEKISKLTPAFALDQFYDSPIATLSMGTRQKISIIAALLHEPSLLLLDEPLNGLDAKTSRIVKDVISLHTRKSNGAVLFSTHIMEVAEQVCDRIGIIYEGKIVAEGTLEELRKKASEITVAANGNSQESNGTAATLEEVFLKLTHEEDDIAGTVRALREAFYVDK